MVQEVEKSSTMTESSKDNLFKVDSIEEDFVFNERVVEVFDDMLERSIPCYKQVIESSARLLVKFLTPGDTLYDLGCSNGTSLLAIAGMLPDDCGFSYTGIDNSAPMLEKARLKTELFSKQDSVSYLLEDITQFNHPGAGAIILGYTLQFIRPLQRESFLKSLYRCLRPGGVLLLSEKIISHDRRLNREYIDIYHQFKKSRGYSELEIAKKREALENVLIPFSIAENKEILTKCGFTAVETYFQWFNFVSMIAVKTV
ncbi:carboxy-S-adenosyl-L-methionine synthase CmoA [Desulforhopalus singaporensis]|uniref:Carboxy-S-adenosyl-L-methionine synthase n=1 Tax=Desulforhopalus singaporensis TaxID=91360 RepID=A0A1H0NDG7_9BACT|nr:carboxy-S-adenosyl-L-methionine synthase CmoA [Desulforhopalus singaporensis]SDO90757.1 tRNA (cmo5U34)-methyltransferase [Desulforhopalus singaporensis]